MRVSILTMCLLVALVGVEHLNVVPGDQGSTGENHLRRLQCSTLRPMNENQHIDVEIVVPHAASPPYKFYSWETFLRLLQGTCWGPQSVALKQNNALYTGNKVCVRNSAADPNTLEQDCAA